MVSNYRKIEEINEREKNEIAELLFQEIELRKKNKQAIPTPGELSKIALLAYDNLKISDAPSCIKLMETKYSKELEELGYKKKK